MRAIKLGESQVLDFKYAINSAEKIAISMVAFANADGGSLLVGVKDNGSIKGANVQEDLYVLQRAITKHIIPEIEYQFTQWDISGKPIIEAYIPPNQKNKPFKWVGGQNEEKAFIRINDENIAANSLWVRVQQQLKSASPAHSKILPFEQQLLQFIKQKGSATANQICRHVKKPYHVVSTSLVSLICLKVIDLHITKTSNYITLHNQPTK
ncbi:MAG: ATP-binding protein [Bacteroidetes bacterium]|nr:ATP-binding protein [Bacteroidota bacterium]